MRLVEDKCPSCGARIRVDADEKEATCQYCNAAFRVGPTPDPAAQARQRALEVNAHRVAGQAGDRGKRGAKAAPVVFGVLVLAGAVVAVLAGSPSSPASSPAPTVQQAAVSASPPAPPERPSWLPHQQAILNDLTGDDVADPIGWARYYGQPNTPQHLVALNGATGAQLWQSELFSSDDWSDIRVAGVGDHLVVADTTGMLRAIATASGKTQWTAPLGERVRRFCARTPTGVLAYLDDDRAVEAALATGSITPKGTVNRLDLACEQLAGIWPGDDPRVPVETSYDIYGGRLDIEGLDTGRVVRPEGSPLAFALGMRSVGTHVPMVAAFSVPASWPPRGEGGSFSATWKVAIAGATPGSAAAKSPAVAWFSEGRLYTSYSTTGSPALEHLVCLDGATGAQVYDVVLEGVQGGRLDGLAGAGKLLYVTHAGGLDVFDAATGAHARHLSD